MILMRNEWAVSLQEAFDSFQRRNRFIDKAMGTALSPVEAHLLVEVDGQLRIGATELSALLALSKVTVAAVIQRLLDQGLLKTERDPADSRKKPIILSARGTDLLRTFDSQANQQMAEFCDSISMSEQQSVLEFLTKIADGLRAPISNLRPADHPFRPVVRRLTRALGLLGTYALNSNTITILQRHILVLAQNDKAPTAKELCTHLHTAPNTLSQALASLRKRGLISQIPASPTDKRLKNIVLTQAGSRELKRLNRSITTLLEQSFRALSPIPSPRQIKLVTRWCKGERDEALLQQRIVVTQIRGEVNLRTARGFLVRNLVRRNEELSLQSAVLSEKHACFELNVGSTLKGVCEFGTTKSSPVLLHKAVSIELEGSEIEKRFIEQARLLSAQ